MLVECISKVLSDKPFVVTWLVLSPILMTLIMIRVDVLRLVHRLVPVAALLIPHARLVLVVISVVLLEVVVLLSLLILPLVLLLRHLLVIPLLPFLRLSDVPPVAILTIVDLGVSRSITKICGGWPGALGLRL